MDVTLLELPEFDVAKYNRVWTWQHRALLAIWQIVAAETYAHDAEVNMEWAPRVHHVRNSQFADVKTEAWISLFWGCYESEIFDAGTGLRNMAEIKELTYGEAAHEYAQIIAVELVHQARMSASCLKQKVRSSLDVARSSHIFAYAYAIAKDKMKHVASEEFSSQMKNLMEHCIYSSDDNTELLHCSLLLFHNPDQNNEELLWRKFAYLGGTEDLLERYSKYSDGHELERFRKVMRG